MLQVAFGLNPDHADYEVFREEFLNNYEQAMTVRTAIFEGVPEMLDALQQRGLRWGVVTNKHQRFTLPLTRQMPLFNTAQAVVSGDTMPHPKPHPAPLLEAARLMGLPPEACWYVGDDERDIVAGKAAGMPTVAAHYGYLGAQDEVLQWGADHIIQSPLALLALLQA